jgi:hypothetical protein
VIKDMLKILELIQKEYEETRISDKRESSTPCICGYYGRGCRVSRIDTNGGKCSVFSMLCGLGRGSDCCPIRAKLYDKYGSEKILYPESNNIIKDGVQT